MGDLTKNISRYETKCHCNRCKVYIQAHEPILAMVQAACDHFAKEWSVDKVQLELSSAARCYAYNRLPTDVDGPGSNDESQHPRCTAIDAKIFVNGTQVSPQKVYDYFDSTYPDSCGVGLYSSFTHIDSRPYKARW